MRKFRKCGEEKPLDMFVIDPRSAEGRMWRCKACHAGIQRVRLSDPELREKDNARRKVWHQRHYRMRRYGIDAQEYDRIFAAQGERCCLCGSDDAGRGSEWCIDHDHKTERVRGILCHRCNISLGHYEKVLETIGINRLREYLTDQRKIA